MSAPSRQNAGAHQATRLVSGLSLEPDTVRGVATRAALIAETVPWHSPAATAFRARVTRTAVALRGAADDLDSALQLLRRYTRSLPACDR